MAKDTGRTCLGCKHFHIATADAGYSELTPGSDFDMSCYKNVWTFKPYDDDTNKFASHLRTAADCKHYEFAEDRA